MSVSNDQLMEKPDKVMGKLMGMEEEFTLQMEKYEIIGELENRIEDLDQRLQKLETRSL